MSFICLSLVLVVSVEGYIKLCIAFKKSTKSAKEKVKSFFKLFFYLFTYLVVVVLVGSIFNYMTKVDYDWTTKGFSDLYQITTRTDGTSFGCVNLIDVNSNNILVWNHHENQVVVIPNAKIATIKLMHDEMPSKGMELLSGGSNGNGREPPMLGDKGDSLQRTLSPREQYNNEIQEWFKSVDKTCPGRIVEQDVLEKMYSF
jgi:hypothetical protein